LKWKNNNNKNKFSVKKCTPSVIDGVPERKTIAENVANYLSGDCAPIRGNSDL
jgi:hypothetical protein